jgi:hypothetical protein
MLSLEDQRTGCPGLLCRPQIRFDVDNRLNRLAAYVSVGAVSAFDIDNIIVVALLLVTGIKR